MSDFDERLLLTKQDSQCNLGDITTVGTTTLEHDS
jgi:hypothetical protein